VWWSVVVVEEEEGLGELEQQLQRRGAANE